MYFNAHCHLELSHLKGRIPSGLSFVEWLRRLVALKRATTREESEAGARAGLARLRETGTTAVLDILSLDSSIQPLREWSAGGSGALLLWELLRFDPDQAESLLKDRLAARPADLRHGLSPHAPYTTSEALLRGAAREVAARSEWLCIHAAETAEETEMMLHGSGPLHEFLAPFLPAGWKPPGMRPIAWLAACGCLGPRTLLVHCNDLESDDVEAIRRSGAHAVVCPGTHVYFARGPFPLKRLLDAGIPVHLGTDSLASNADLDMEREVRLAVELSPGVDPEVIRSLALAPRAAGFLR
jgi:cytosine/adenosine deaminase-related metal-dependent hydrolase